MTRKRLFYDIETSFCEGWFYRPDWNTRIYPHQIVKHAKIISIHWKWEGGKVHHLHWGLKKQCDKKMIQKFLKVMDRADEIIHFNGKKFDTPWIRQRAMFHGLDMHHSYNEIDCYSLVKKYLKQLPDKRLKGVCEYFSLPNKIDAGGHETWAKVIFDKDKEAFEHMLYYGDGDVISLEAVFEKLRPYIKPNLHYGVLRGNEKFHCPNCGSLPHYKQMYTTAAGTIQHWLQCSDRKECRTQFKVNNVTYQRYQQYKLLNGIK